MRYLVIGYARSGTTVTHHIISGHPQVASLLGELKPEPFYTQGKRIFTFGNEPCNPRIEYPKLFDCLTKFNATADILANGTKTVCNSHRQAENIVDVLRRYLPDIYVIIVKRRDLVAQMGSGIHSKKSGVAHSWRDGADRLKVRKIRISKHKFISYIYNVRRLYSVFDGLNESHKVLNLTYEDLSDMDTYSGRIFDFLGIENLKPTWLHDKKIMPGPSEYIKNYSKMSSILNGYDNLCPLSLFFARAIGHLCYRAARLIPRAVR
jgi:hypothetical protein